MSKKAFLVLSILSLLLIILIFQYLSRPQVVGWDESWYIYHGYNTLKALRAQDWPMLQLLTFKINFYPFVHRWYIAIMNLPFRYSVMSARAVCLILLWPVILLLWQMAQELKPKNRTLPILAVGLHLVSPVIIFFFSLALTDSLALFLTLACLWLFWRGRDKQKIIYFFLSGITCQLLFFTKYNYAFLLWPTLILEGLIWLIEEKAWLNKKILVFLSALFGPIFFLTLWWILRPGNWSVIYSAYLVNFSEFPSTWQMHLPYYPLELAFSFSFSWVACILLMIGFVWRSSKGLRQFKVRSLASLFLFNFLLMEFKVPFKTQARYLFSTISGFFLVGSLGLVELWPKVRKIHLKPLALGFLLPFIITLALIMLWDLIKLPFMVKPTGSHNVGHSAFYEPDFEDNTRFNFNRQDWPHQSAPLGSEKIEDIFEFVFQNVDIAKEMVQVGAVNEFSPLLFYYNLDRAREKNVNPQPGAYQKYWVVSEFLGRIIGDVDIRQTHRGSNAWAEQTLIDPSLKIINQKVFPYLGVRVSIMVNR